MSDSKSRSAGRAKAEASQTKEAREARALTKAFLDVNGFIGGGRRRGALESDDAKEQERFGTWLAHASFVYRCLPYKVHEPPSRPVDLPGDHAIHATLEKSRRKTRAGRKPTNAEFDVVAIFGAWLTEVLRTEEENRGTFETVLRAIGVIEEVDPNDTRAAELRVWLAKASAKELPDRVFWRDRDWLSKASFMLSRNESTMPTWLREGQRPPDFDPTAYAEDDDG